MAIGFVWFPNCYSEGLVVALTPPLWWGVVSSTTNNNYYGDNMINNYFVCTKGDEKEIFMITLDKGLAERCLNDNICDDVMSIGTIRDYTEIARIFARDDCRTLVDLEYMIMHS